MLKGGVIMDVTNDEEARIAEEAGAVAVMALERVPADIRRDGGVARMSDPTMIKVGAGLRGGCAECQCRCAACQYVDDLRRRACEACELFLHRFAVHNREGNRTGGRYAAVPFTI